MFGLGVNSIWAVTTIGKIVVAAYSLRGRHRYPFFVAFCWASLLLSCALWMLALERHDLGYFWTYYAGNLAKDLIFVGCLYEITASMFFPLWILPRTVARTAVSFVACVTIASILFAIRFPSQHPQRIVSSARTSDKVVTMIFLAVVILVAALSSYLRVRWLKRSAFILGGFALFLFVDSAVFMVLMGERVQWFHLLGYLLAETVWVIGMLQEDAPVYRLNNGEVRKLCRWVNDSSALGDTK